MYKVQSTEYILQNTLSQSLCLRITLHLYSLQSTEYTVHNTVYRVQSKDFCLPPTETQVNCSLPQTLKYQKVGTVLNTVKLTALYCT